jgi:hypothetical protein
MKMKEEERTHSLLRVGAALIIGRSSVGVFRVWGVGVGLRAIWLGDGVVVGDVLWGVVRGRGGVESGC